MNVHFYLKKIGKLDEQIECAIAECDRLNAIAYSISSPAPDGMPHGTDISKKIENAVVKLVDKSNEVDRLIDEYVDLKEKITKQLAILPAKEYGVIHRYYVEGMTNEEIAEKMGYSISQIYRIKKNALRILKDAMVCEGSSDV